MVIRISQVVLGFVLLFVLLPISNRMSSVEAMQMGALSSLEYDGFQGNASHSSPSSCCEAIGSFLFACDFMIFQPEYASASGGNEQIAYSVPVVQSIFIESLSPPPKA
jgi:hypothetical protein